jgi:hypothetical protein
LFKRALAAMRRHVWWISFLAVPAIGGLGWWVSGVNADSKRTAVHDALLPKIESQLNQISAKQDKMNDGITDIQQRVSNIEGRLSR